MNFLNKSIAYSFYLLIFTVPLILFPNTSEIFEFNKIVFTYAMTIIITLLWVTKIIFQKKVIFRRTFLDLPIVLFLLAMFVTTLVSMNIHTSIFGFYSRFHGGLLSWFAYSILYWAFVSNLDKEKGKNCLYSFIASAVFVCFYGILQHFGIDKHIWIQDVQTRIFSTFGQPNWLAAWLVALLPLTWVFTIQSSLRIQNNEGKINWLNFWTWNLINFIFLITVSYTQSRSGFLGLITAGAIFWLGILFINVRKSKKLETDLRKKVAALFVLSVIALLIAGTPWFKSLGSLINNANHEETSSPTVQQTVPSAPLLEVGGSSSVEIRKIVWKGAFDVWKNNPIFGTGPETFAYSYYYHRPVEHNLVSEWDFLYNKAHNEYLNFLATTGIVGFSTYLLLLAAILWLLYVNFKTSEDFEEKLINLALFSGIISICVTIFFGFSVVPLGIQLFLFPAISVALKNKAESAKSEIVFDDRNKILFGVIGVIAGWLLIQLAAYWRADIYYAQGRAYNDIRQYQQASKLLEKAIEINSSESEYWQELADASAGIAILLAESGNEHAPQVSELAVDQSRRAVALSPGDINALRKQGNTFLKLSLVDLKYLSEAEISIEKAVELAPTEAKLMYNLGVIELRLGKMDEAKQHLIQTIELKPDYADARFALATLHYEENNIEQAREQLQYILEQINPSHEQSQELINKLNQD